MYRKYLEPVLLITLIGIIYFSPIFSSQLPVFWDDFNTVDGSLYAVRLFDVLLSVCLVMIASRYFIPHQLSLRSLSCLALFILFILAASSLLEWGWDTLTRLAFNLPMAANEVSDKALIYQRRETLDLSIVMGNVLVIFVGVFYGLILDRNQQIRQQEQLQREHLEAEVNYLRSQINPHFLFNTLNNIYAITQRNDDMEGSDALLRLSGLMRYMLYESSGREIELHQEIEHLENYRDLMLLKYNAAAPPEIDFQVQSIPEHCMVAPLILLPFVENAFKHGIDNQGRGSIRLQLQVLDQALIFTLINSRFPDRLASKEHKGIGLDNVKQRLKHLYPLRHDLTITPKEDCFEIHLRIQL